MVVPIPPSCTSTLPIPAAAATSSWRQDPNNPFSFSIFNASSSKTNRISSRFTSESKISFGKTSAECLRASEASVWEGLVLVGSW